MRLIPLGIITFLLGGCFFQPVEDFVDQMDDQYFADEFNYIPTEIKPYDKKASMELIWENKVGDNEVNNFNLGITSTPAVRISSYHKIPLMEEKGTIISATITNMLFINKAFLNILSNTPIFAFPKKKVVIMNITTVNIIMFDKR